MKPNIFTAVLLFYSYTTFADFQCDPVEKPLETCNNQLECYFDEGFVEQLNRTRYCRCKTVIQVLPLPDNILTYDLFRKICSLHETRLQELWVVDAEVEYIDNEIFAYPNLKTVSLAGNRIRVNFSEKAQNLNVLDLSNNGLNSLEKDAFTSLKSLKVMNVSYNRLDRTNFCFSEMKDIEEIYLNNNQLTNVSRTEFDNLYKLRILNLANNFLVSLDSNLFLINLQELYLNNNQLTSINRQEFVNLPNLRILNIGDNLIKSIGDRHTFANLEELHCENNKIEEVNINVFNKLHNLKHLNLSNNEVRSLKNNTFSTINNLKVIDVSSNKINYIDPGTFQNFQNISSLNLNNNSLTEEVISCDNLKNLPQLSNLQLSFNQISIIYDCTFSQLENLSKLTLLANRLEKIPPSVFSALTKLEELNLAQNQIMEIPEGVFDNLTQLTKLNISYNKLTKFDLNQLNNIPKITEFDIHHNDLKELNLRLLKNKLPSLKVVDFDENLVKCEDYSDVLKYFDDESIIVRSCPVGMSCCDNGMNIKLIVIIVVAVIVCLLAVVGLFVILCKVCRPKEASVVHLVPLMHNNQ